MGTSEQALPDIVAANLCSTLCNVINCVVVRWPVVDATVRVLEDLVLVVTSQKAEALCLEQLIGYLQNKILQPCASQLLQVWKALPELEREEWLHEFQEQWAAHMQESPSDQMPTYEAVFEGVCEASSFPDGRMRCFQILFSIYRLTQSLAGIEPTEEQTKLWSGIDEGELEDELRFRPGVSIDLGESNRVKCHTVSFRDGSWRSSDGIILYLVPTRTHLLLVQPDGQGQSWSYPVIVEPMRLVSLLPTTDMHLPADTHASGENSDELTHVLQLGVSLPRSPILQRKAQRLRQQQRFVDLDHMRPVTSTATSSTMSATSHISTQPTDSGSRVDACSSVVPLGLRVKFALGFTDARRLRVALRVISGMRLKAYDQMLFGFNMFLTDLERGCSNGLTASVH